MKEIGRIFLKHIKLLNKSIYTGDRLETNLTALSILAVVGTVFGTVMTILNIVQGKGALLILTTSLFIANGIFVFLSIKLTGKREPATITTFFVSAFAFSFFAINGSNGGVSMLWAFLIPIVICYFIGVKYGILLSIYFEILFIVLFYTPLSSRFAAYYPETFMVRFPLLYLCEVVITLIAMTQYHESALFEVEYADKLGEEVARQTHIANERLKQSERTSDEMVLALARAVDAKDKYTNGHSIRVSRYSVALAEKIGWDKAEVKKLKREALLHDIGKIGVPDAVLNKPGRLTDEEYETIKSHTTIGNQILEGLADMHDVAEVVLYHHERYDGNGYPMGLAGKDIPDRARVVAIADAYDAMSSDRIYRPALDKDRIRRELERGSGKQFDPEYLSAFLELFDGGMLADCLD